MFRERVFSSIGIVLVLGLGMYVGGLVWVALITLLVWGALKEYADMLMPQGYKVPLPLLMLLAVFMAALQSYNIGIISELALLVAFIAMVVWLVTTQDGFANFAFGFMGYMMIAWTLSFLVCLEAMGEGWRFTLLAFLIVWATDAGAYCTGMLFGRHKMAPVISPKKAGKAPLAAYSAVCWLLLYITAWCWITPGVLYFRRLWFALFLGKLAICWSPG